MSIKFSITVPDHSWHHGAPIGAHADNGRIFDAYRDAFAYAGNIVETSPNGACVEIYAVCGNVSVPLQTIVPGCGDFDGERFGVDMSTDTQFIAYPVTYWQCETVTNDECECMETGCAYCDAHKPTPENPARYR